MRKPDLLHLPISGLLRALLLSLILVSSSTAFLQNKNSPSQLQFSFGRSRTGGRAIVSPALLSSPSFYPTPGSTTESSSSPSATKKNDKKKKQKQKQGGVTMTRTEPKRGRGIALTDDQLVEHVSGVYSTGRRRGQNEVMTRRTMTQDVKRAQFLQKLSERHALVLNADYQPLDYLPLSRWSWQDAVTAVLSGKVTVVETYDDVTIRTANLEIPLPSVIALNDYVHNRNRRPAFTRRNVFLRDEYRCAYCSHRFHTADLSLDHVFPRCRGGRLSWENTVTACLKCNGKKGSLTVQELRSVGMKLSREPAVPTQYELSASAAKLVPRRVNPQWAPYLGMHDMSTSSSSNKNNRERMSSSSNENEMYL